jgi:hypothetical protein
MPIDIQTFSIVIGGPRCDAHCPFCVSKQTGLDEVARHGPDINWRNLAKAWGLVDRGRCTTVLMTGKGEPLLYPDEISSYLEWFNELYRQDNLLLEHVTDVPAGLGLCTQLPLLAPMPLIELQTNALRIGDIVSLMDDPEPYPMPRWLERDRDEYHEHSPDGQFHTYVAPLHRTLTSWHRLGLDTIAISAVETGTELNSQVYRRDYPPLERTVAYLREIGFTVRLCIMMMKGGVDSFEKLAETADWCRKNDVAQLTARPIRRPVSSRSDKASSFVKEHGLSDAEAANIATDLERRFTATPILSLAHGATVYDLDGQNVCLADCLTDNVKYGQGIRTLIFYSDGRLTYDWQHKGAIILSGKSGQRE